jgi:hypothetical protein
VLSYSRPLRVMLVLLMANEDNLSDSAIWSISPFYHDRLHPYKIVMHEFQLA